MDETQAQILNELRLINLRLDDLTARIWGLHGWEAANELLWHTMDRADITDGPIVSESTSAALAACGVQ